MPVRRDFLVPSVFLRSLDCFDCAKERIDSRTPQLSASLKNLSDGWHLPGCAPGRQRPRRIGGGGDREWLRGEGREGRAVWSGGSGEGWPTVSGGGEAG